MSSLDFLARLDGVAQAQLVARGELNALELLDACRHARLAGLDGPSDDAAAAELLDFWIAQRLVVVVLLDRAQGSPQQASAERFVARLLRVSLAEIRRAQPGTVVTREARLVLQQVFENTRRMLAVLLESCTEEAAIHRAVAAFRSYQVAGLGAFARALAASKH